FLRVLGVSQAVRRRAQALTDAPCECRMEPTQVVIATWSSSLFEILRAINWGCTNRIPLAGGARLGQSTGPFLVFEAAPRRLAMQLRKVHVTNFKIVDDSNEFTIDRVTCLIGKNESGKTALLDALCRLNPYGAGSAQYDKVEDYPRRYLLEYD